MIFVNQDTTGGISLYNARARVEQFVKSYVNRTEQSRIKWWMVPPGRMTLLRITPAYYQPISGSQAFDYIFGYQC
jgi:hypothetical protein